MPPLSVSTVLIVAFITIVIIILVTVVLTLISLAACEHLCTFLYRPSQIFCHSCSCLGFNHYHPGVSGNSRLPYKFVGISHEFIRQKGIPAHPCWQPLGAHKNAFKHFIQRVFANLQQKTLTLCKFANSQQKSYFPQRH